MRLCDKEQQMQKLKSTADKRHE